MNYWQGKKIRLRAISGEDAGLLAAQAVEQDEWTERAADYISLPMAAEEAEQRILNSAENSGDAFRFLIETLDGEIAGDLQTFDCDIRTGTFQLGLAIEPDFRGNGYATEAIEMVLAYYFGELRYQKANATVRSFNEAAIGLFESMNFLQEGRLRRMAYTGGNYYDHLLFGITQEEFFAAHPSWTAD